MSNWKERIFELMVERRMLVLSGVAVFIIALCVAVGITSSRPKDSIYNYEDSTSTREKDKEKEEFQTMEVAEDDLGQGEDTKHFETLNESELSSKETTENDTTKKSQETTTKKNTNVQEEQTTTALTQTQNTGGNKNQNNAENSTKNTTSIKQTQNTSSSDTEQNTKTTTSDSIHEGIIAPPVENPDQNFEENTTPEQICQHSSISYEVTDASSVQKGEWKKLCSDCMEVLESGVIPAYDAYSVNIGGAIEKVYGYYSESLAQDMIALVNTYRSEQGMASLENACTNSARLRVAECAYSYSHTRPNGENCFTVAGVGEVLVAENMYTTLNIFESAGSIVEAWKADTRYINNLLNSTATKTGAAVFVQMKPDENGIMREQKLYAVQVFGE